MTRNMAMATVVLLLASACAGGASLPVVTGSFKAACLAANQGEAAAQSSVGDRYRRVGVDSDRYPPPSDSDIGAYQRAYMWYSLAAANGDLYGASRKRSLADELTPDQIAGAEMMAADWRPDPSECDVAEAEAADTTPALSAYAGVGERPIAGSFKAACLEANKGITASQSSVGDRYRRVGVDSDLFPRPSESNIGAYQRAYMWYSLAAAKGDGYGASRRNSLAEVMTPEQVAGAEMLVADWKPDPGECDGARAAPEAVEAAPRISAYDDTAVPEITGSFKVACLAANQGQAAAQSSVGDRYRRVGVDSDRFPPPSDNVTAYKRAYMWYSLAAANGDDYGAKRGRSLAGQMTPQQISEAEQLVADWQPDPTECG